MPENESFSRFEVMRHGEKKSGGSLSEHGAEQAKEKAQEIFDRIGSLPSGAVVSIFSSNIGRAIDTKNIIETELRELAADAADIEFVDVRDLEKIQEVKERNDKKFVIVGAVPQTSLGWTDADPAFPGADKYLALYGNEDVLGKIWIARKDEIPKLQDELKEAYPQAGNEPLEPSELVVTPEEYGMQYLRFLQRIKTIAAKHFGDKPFDMINVGHNFHADFMTMGALEMPMNAKSIEELGNKFRDFAESSEIVVQDGKMTVSYRDQILVKDKSLDDVLKYLEASSSERKLEWAAEKLA